MPPSDGSAEIIDVPAQLAGIRLRLARKPDIGISLFFTGGDAFPISPGSVSANLWERSTCLLLPIKESILVL